MPKNTQMNRGRAMVAARLRDDHNLKPDAASRHAKASTISADPTDRQVTAAVKRALAAAQASDFYAGYAPKRVATYPIPRWAREVAARKGDVR